MNKKKRGNYKTKNVLLLSKIIKEDIDEKDKEKKDVKKDGGN